MTWLNDYKQFLEKEYRDYLIDAEECLGSGIGDVSWFLGFSDGLHYALYMLNRMESENAKETIQN